MLCIQNVAIEGIHKLVTIINTLEWNGCFPRLPGQLYMLSLPLLCPE